MEFLFSQIKKMDVVSVNDGKNLGRVCDLAFLYPENRIKGFFVTGSRGFHFSKSDMFIPIKQVVKIGEDVILVNTEEKPPKQNGCGKPPYPPNCPPSCPPCPPMCQPDPRRDFNDYE